MKYNIIINQKAIIDNGFDLDIDEAIILDFCSQFFNSSSVTKFIYNNENYYWVSHNLILQNIPMFKLGKDSIYKKMKSLCEKGFLKVHPETQKMGKSFYAIDVNFEKLLFAPTENIPNPTEKKDNLRKKIRTPSENIPNTFVKNSEAPTENIPNYNVIKEKEKKDYVHNDNIYSSPSQSIEDVKYYFEFTQIINLLEERTNAKYKIPKTAAELSKYKNYITIKERLEDGSTLEECLNVIESKFAEWTGTDMQKYLVIETLFRKSNFEKYLVQSQINTPKKQNQNGIRTIESEQEIRLRSSANIAQGFLNQIHEEERRRNDLEQYLSELEKSKRR